MATASQLAQKAELLMAAAASDTVAELRHIHGIADKLLVAQEGVADKLLAALTRQERVACLQRGRMIVRNRNGSALSLSAWLHDWALGQLLRGLLRGLPAVNLAAYSQWSDVKRIFNSEGGRAEYLSELEGLTGMRFRLEEDAQGNWCLHLHEEQQQ